MDAAPAPEEPTPPLAATEWEPGVPSVRNLLPSIIGGAVVPLAVYYLVRHRVHTDADALIIAGIFPAAWVTVQFVRQRRIDPVGAIVLFGFVVGVAASLLLGGNAYVLKVRDSVFTAVLRPRLPRLPVRHETSGHLLRRPAALGRGRPRTDRRL